METFAYLYKFYYYLELMELKKLDATFSAPIFGMVQKNCNKYYVFLKNCLKNIEKIMSYIWIMIAFRNYSFSTITTT